jgi:iron complex transport system ATP-binding protein
MTTTPLQQTATPLLATESLTAAYRTAEAERIALRDVSLAANAGEVVALIGPNGSGKTTFIRAVTGVLKPVSGRVVLSGRDTTTLPQREIARLISVVPQDPNLPAAFTAFEMVLMGRTPHLRLLENEGLRDADAARRAMVATDTLSLAERRLGELSGGERQRVIVARALAQETPVLLLDEPTAHLDVGHQVAVLSLVRDIARRDAKAVVAVVHDLTLAAQYCDRLVMLRNGSILASGTPDEVLRPGILREVYGHTVEVFPHPRTGRPVVTPADTHAPYV